MAEPRLGGVQRGPTLGYNTELAEVHIDCFPGRLRKLYAPTSAARSRAWYARTETIRFPAGSNRRRKLFILRTNIWFAMADWDYEIVDAYYFEIGFSTSGWRVLKDLKKK